MKKEISKIITGNAVALNPQITDAVTQSPAPSDLGEAWGAENVDVSTDIRIPKILLMQSISKKVASGDVEVGDLVDSITYEVLGRAKGPKKEESTISVVPIYMFKSWVVTYEKNGKMEYLKTLPYLATSTMKEREEIIAGVKHQNNLTYNVLAMKESDLGDPSAFPVMLSLNRMSANCGKDIFSYAQRAQMANKPVCAFTLKLGAEPMTNEKGTFGVFKLRGATETKDLAKHVVSLKAWHTTFKSGKAVVDDADLTDVTSEEIPAGEYKGQF